MATFNVSSSHGRAAAGRRICGSLLYLHGSAFSPDPSLAEASQLLEQHSTACFVFHSTRSLLTLDPESEVHAAPTGAAVSADAGTGTSTASDRICSEWHHETLPVRVFLQTVCAVAPAPPAVCSTGVSVYKANKRRPHLNILWNCYRRMTECVNQDLVFSAEC